MKAKVSAFIEGLIPLDYVLFGSSFVLFIFFIIIGLLVRKKIGLSLLFILLSFSTLILGPTLGYIKLHEYLFKNSVKLTSQKKLTFTEALIVKGTLTNESKKNFKSCKITASVYAVTSNKYKNYLKKLKPFKKMSIVEEGIAISQTRSFKIIVEPFTYSKDFNVSLGANCK